MIVCWDYRDERIRVFGPVALLWAVNKHAVVRDGKETTGMTAYTDTHLLENGEWKCILAQSTPVAPENCPPDATIVKKYVRGEPQP